MEIISRCYPIVYYMYLLGHYYMYVAVGFGSFAVEITEIMWPSDVIWPRPAVRFPENNCTR